jgi:hypothetical protein
VSTARRSGPPVSMPRQPDASGADGRGSSPTLHPLRRHAGGQGVCCAVRTPTCSS